MPRSLGHRVASATHNRIDSPRENGVREIKKAEQQPQVKRMNLNVPVELHNSFKAATAAQGQNMTDVLMAYIEEYVARNGQPAKKKGRR